MDFKDQRGFTLVEVMSVVIILAIVMAGIMDLYARGIIFWSKGEKKVEVQDNLRIGLDRMTRELRQARQLYDGTTGNKLVFKNFDGSIVAYDIYGTSLRRNSEPLANYINANNGLQIKWSPAGSLQNARTVTITLSGSDSMTDTYTLSTTVRLRTPQGS